VRTAIANGDPQWLTQDEDVLVFQAIGNSEGSRQEAARDER
jgi:hypothetical protein